MSLNVRLPRFRMKREKKLFLRKNIRAILFWPAVCLALGMLLALLLVSMLHTTRQHLESRALVEVRVLSETYAQQIGRAVGELDHVTALLRSNWEHSHGKFRLEDIGKEDQFVDSSLVGIALVDRNGIVVSSTLHGPVGRSIRDREYFQFHQAHRSLGLHVSPPLIGRREPKEIVVFSRRLSLPNGDFDGILLASTGAPFLTGLANKSTIGAKGILALVGDDGVVRAAKIGSEIENVRHPKIIKASALAFPDAAAVISERNWFLDGKVRYLASQPVLDYPLRAIVGLGQDDVMRSVRAARSTYLQIGIAGACVLALFAVVALVMSTRLLWRQYREETVRRAYRVATEGANEGFYMWRPIYGAGDDAVDFELVDCNEKGALLYGSRRRDILNSRIKELYPDSLGDQLLALAARVMRIGFHEDEFKTVSDSVATPAWIYRKFVRTSDGIAVTLRDISERKRLEQETARLAEQDTLTELPNRNWLAAYLPAVLQQSAAEGRILAVLFVDLDAFKNVNDSWGHSTGDQLLHAVAKRIRSALRPTDKVARFGGDEFIVLLEGMTCESDASEIAHRIGELLEEPFNIMQRECLVGASIGISLFPRDGTDSETLIRNADIAMYAAKSDAKGHYRFFDQDFFATIQRRLEIERQLLQAIEADQFVVHYQPRVDALSGALVGMEALVRWTHPERGLVHPAEFISIAESSGLILQLGEVVMEKVCAQQAQWRADGLSVVPVSVNASAKQFNEGKVRDLFTASLARHDLPASLIEIELTESIMVSNAEQVFDELKALHAMGVSVHLDDFGTGYSSLSALHKLDVDVLKVDRAFTAQLGESEEGEIFFRAIISMAKSLDMRVIAEGVETPEQLRLLQRLGCDEIQGYLISRPLPADDVPGFHRQSGIDLFAAEQVWHSGYSYR